MPNDEEDRRQGVSQRELSLILKRLEERDSEMALALRGLSDNLRSVSEMQGRISERLMMVTANAEALSIANAADHRTLTGGVKKVTDAVFGGDGSMGLELRIDRVEQALLRQQRIANFLFGGGLLTFVASVGLLIRILSQMEHTP